MSHCETLQDQTSGPRYQLQTLHHIILGILAVITLLVVVSTLVDLAIRHHRKKDDAVPIKKHKVLDTLFAFSLCRSITELFGSSVVNSSGKGKVHTIDAINGIRSLSTVWMVYEHTYLLPFKETTTGARHFIFIVQEVWFQFIINGWFLVDTFFLLAAILLTGSTLRSLSRSRGSIQPVQLLFNRILRLWPSLLVTVGTLFLLPRLSNGPLWHEYWDYQVDKCTNFWWSTIFFFNNWYPEPEICLQHTWYLAADIQLFIIGLVLITLIFWKKRLGFLLVGSIFVGSIVGIALRTFFYNLPPTVNYNSPSET